MNSEIFKISSLVKDLGGKAYLVGGCVRDMKLEIEPKDWDIEVYGISVDSLISVLSKSYQIDLVGKSFGVLKLKGLPIDVSFPRREVKNGDSHKDFVVSCDPNMSLEEAALRRDFTVNALMFDVLTETYIDPTNRGLSDLENKILDPVSEKFNEDPLRVLRAMQFIARFGFSPSDKLIVYSRSLTPKDLSKERIFEEWNKFFLKGENMSAGTKFLVDSWWINFFPEILAIKDTPQDPVYHPEKEVLLHTGFVLDAFAKERTGNDEEDLIMGYACLCHDFGKATHTFWYKEKEKWVAYGHEEAGEKPTRSFMEKLTNQEKFVNEIVNLVKHHLKPRLLFKAGAGKTAVRKLALQVRIDRLCKINKLDQMGRPPLVFTEFPEVDWLLKMAENLNVVDKKTKAHCSRKTPY